MPQIELIMVTHNNLNFTKKAIASIQKFTSLDYRLIVIDSGSSDGTSEWLHKSRIECKLFRSNIGVASARNCGTKHLSKDCQFVVFLDNDIEITQPDWLENLLGGFINPKIGAVGPCSDFAYGLQDMNLRIRQRFLKVPYLITFCICIRRDVVDLIGKFDGFGRKWGNTDIDYSVRMRKAGFDLINARNVFVKHKGFETIQRQEELPTLMKMFVEKYDKEIFDELGNWRSWIPAQENQEKQKIQIKGIPEKIKLQIEKKLKAAGYAI